MKAALSMADAGKIGVAHLFRTIRVGGGVQRSMSLLLPRLNRARFRPLALVLEGAPGAPEHELPGVEIVRCALGGHWEDWWRRPCAVQALGRELARCRVDLLHCHQAPEQWIGCLAAAPLRVPVIRTVHRVPDGRFFGLGFRARLLSALTSAYTSVSPGWSPAFEKELRIRRRQCSYIPNGIDPSELHRPPGTRERVRLELGVREDDVLVLGVGRLVPNKDFATMIGAFALALPQAPGLRLAIAGEGPEMGRLRAEIGRLGLDGTARMLGVRPDVPDLLGASDIFMITSLTESMSYASAEAMASSRPVIASDIPVLRSMLAHGEAGLLVPAGCPEEGARALVRLAASPVLRTSLGRQARQVVGEMFPLERMVSRYERLYTAVAGRGTLTARRVPRGAGGHAPEMANGELPAMNEGFGEMKR